MIKVVSFDIWGTLLRLDVMLEGITREVSRISGIPEGRVREAFKTARKSIKELRHQGKLYPKNAVEVSQSTFARNLEVDVDVIKRACARAVLFAPEDILIKETLEAVKLAKQLGKSTCCLGNVQFWPSSQTRILLERFGISDFLDKHFFSDELGAFKPQKEAFQAIASFFGVSLDEILHIGDREREDFRGATSAGCQAILIEEGSDLPSLVHRRLLKGGHLV